MEKIHIERKFWDDYLLYLRLRDEASELRINGKIHDHQYFKSYPSCQNRRYMDRESQYYIIARNEYTGNNSITEAIFQLIFRKHSTYQKVKEHFGDFPGNIVTKNSLAITKFILENIEIPFTGAYLVPHRDKSKSSKVEGWLDLFNIVNFEEIREFKTAKESFNFLSKINGFGDFLSMQFVTELGWLNETLYGGNEFVIPGNGAVRGLNKLGIPPKKHVDFLKWLVKKQPLTHSTWKPMTLMDYQNTFCEFDKFTRYLGGYDNQGRERMKRLRKAHPTPITLFQLTDKLKSDKYYA